MYKIIQNWTIDAEIQKQKIILIKDPMAYFSYVRFESINFVCIHCIRDNIFFICLNEKGTAFINMNSICNIYKSN